MTEPKGDKLIVAMVTSDLADCEDFPAGPCVILRGDQAAVKAAARLFGEAVFLMPADSTCDDGTIPDPHQPRRNP